MDHFQITKYEPGLEHEIHQLIKGVYDEFVSGDYSEEGNRFFYEWIDPEKIAERQKIQNTILLAVIDNRIIGMIELRDNRNISLLFVDKNHHGKGIAKALFKESLKKCIPAGSLPDKFYVHASPYSIPVYKKLGFNETDVMQEQFGIKYLPMEMILKK